MLAVQHSTLNIFSFKKFTSNILCLIPQIKMRCKIFIYNALNYFTVARQGIEPRHSDPETDVLPLYYRAMFCKYSFFIFPLKL